MAFELQAPSTFEFEFAFALADRIVETITIYQIYEFYGPVLISMSVNSNFRTKKTGGNNAPVIQRPCQPYAHPFVFRAFFRG